MDRMRKLIADHMVYSKHTSPHVTSFVEADVTALVKWREKVKDKFEKREGEKITFTPIFIEAVVKTIKDFPMINISVTGTQIIKKKDINISMATALPSGNLIVPVIKKADELNLVGITKAVNDLANRARIGKLLPDDVRDGTFYHHQRRFIRQRDGYTDHQPAAGSYIGCRGDKEKTRRYRNQIR